MLQRFVQTTKDGQGCWVQTSTDGNLAHMKAMGLQFEGDNFLFCTAISKRKAVAVTLTMLKSGVDIVALDNLVFEKCVHGKWIIPEFYR